MAIKWLVAPQLAKTCRMCLSCKCRDTQFGRGGVPVGAVERPERAIFAAGAIAGQCRDAARCRYALWRAGLRDRRAARWRGLGRGGPYRSREGCFAAYGLRAMTTSPRMRDTQKKFWCLVFLESLLESPSFWSLRHNPCSVRFLSSMVSRWGVALMVVYDLRGPWVLKSSHG